MYSKKDWQYHVQPYTGLTVPCGTCILCREEQARQTAVRITHEAQLHQENCFVTLTYNDEHLPEHGSLNYEDLQKFWKRVRIHAWRKLKIRLRYYAVGEYGDKSKRAHYHACIFGHAFTNNRTIVREQPHLLWTNPLLEQAWGKGNVSVGALTFATANYTASYLAKKLRRRQQYVRVDEETGECIPLVQPRSFWSLRPAIASTWLATYGDQVYDYDRVVMEGRPQKPPKYYDRWLKNKNEAKHLSIKQQRITKATPLSEQDARARASNARARAKSKSKSV